MSNPQPTDPNAITLFGQTNFRNQQRRFGIKLDDRRRHVYVIGKTGMGKTTLLENMILSDIYAGHGCAYIDPHGDTAEKILDFIPSWRINDVVYFNPADLDNPVGFNILETVNDEQKHLVGSGLMGVFKKIWPDVWSPRMEYILLNCVLALLDYPGATLLGINRLLVDKDYRQRVIEKIRDPIVKTFWVAEFSSWSEKYATEAIAPVQNKVGQFLSASVIRNIVAQVKSTIVPRRIMDDRKIFIVNLSKGRIGEDNMRLLGNMMIIKLQLAAMERVDIPEADRKDFFMYVDEFQNFATPSFANILSEARKYRLALILAHQYIEQLDEEVRDAIFGNVGTIITFRVGSPDALYMEKEFSPVFIPEDLASLPKFGIYLKLMVDGVSTEPFSALTLPPIAQRTNSAEKVIAVSRERYSTTRSDIQEKVLKWSGMETGPILPDMPPDGVVMGGTVSYPKIETEEERESGADAEANTARGEGGGEYLRFSAERLASITKAMPEGSKKKDKPKFPHTCSRCGKVWEMPVQLDPSRPMYCADCLPLIRDEKKVKGKVVKAAVTGAAIDGVDLEEVREEPQDKKKMPSLEDAMRRIEDGGTVAIKKNPEPNRPRIVTKDPERLTEVNANDGEEDEDRSELLQAVADKRGFPVDTKKRVEAVDERKPPVIKLPHQENRPQQPEQRRPEQRVQPQQNNQPRPQSSPAQQNQNPRKDSDQRAPSEPNRPRFTFTPPKQVAAASSGSEVRPQQVVPQSSAQVLNAPVQSTNIPKVVDDDMEDDGHGGRRKRNRHRDLPEDRRRTSLEERFDRAIEGDSSDDSSSKPSAVNGSDAPSATVFKSVSTPNPSFSASRSVPVEEPFGGIRVKPGQRVRFDE